MCTSKSLGQIHIFLKLLTSNIVFFMIINFLCDVHYYDHDSLSHVRNIHMIKLQSWTTWGNISRNLQL